MRILSAVLVAAALASSACKHHHACDASHAQPTVVVRVDDNSDYMKQAAATAVAPVHAMVDNWHADRGAVTDIALTAPDRAALEHFVATLPPPPPGHAIDYGKLASGEWRTYYVESTPLLGNADFATGEPADRGVMLSLTTSAAKNFEAASAAAVGHKLAFVVGDRVESAPVIETAIRGGALQITPGAHDDATPLLDRLGCR